MAPGQADSGSTPDPAAKVQPADTSVPRVTTGDKARDKREVRSRKWSGWTLRERRVTGVIVLVAAAVALSQLNDDGSVAAALAYAGFVLVMVGLVVGAAAVFRRAGRPQVDSGLSAAQKVMLAAGVIVLAWAAASTARMDDGFVLAAFVAQVAIGLVYVSVAGFGAMAMSRARRR